MGEITIEVWQLQYDDKLGKDSGKLCPTFVNLWQFIVCINRLARESCLSFCSSVLTSVTLVEYAQMVYNRKSHLFCRENF